MQPNLAEKYLNELQSTLHQNIIEIEAADPNDPILDELLELKEDFNHFEGASVEQLKALQFCYPDCPQSLIDLLSIVDGTHYRKYQDRTVTTLILGSDLESYPYYLKSAAQMIQHATTTDSIADRYGEDYVEEMLENNDVHIGIDTNAPEGKWLHFSDCMNNGGTSQLFIDFAPTANGRAGQVVRFVHDPDSYEVIANSFDEYLEQQMSEGFPFLMPE